MYSSSLSNRPRKLSPERPDLQKHWRPWESSQSGIAPKPAQHSPPLQCKLDMCNATFKRESELRRHVSSKHSKKRESCAVCNKIFTRKDNLTRHFKLVHYRDERPCCKYCSKTLSRRDAVQRHESTCPKNPSRKLDKYANTVRHHTELVSFSSHLERLEWKHRKSQLPLPSNSETCNTRNA